MLVLSGTIPPNALADNVAVVTGAGRGIGFEAARSLVGLGAKVVIAELDAATGAQAADVICSELGTGRAVFIETDVADEESIRRLKSKAEDRFGKVDIVLNNATITPMGAVRDRPISDWDRSYGVNLRGPVLLAQAFLPGMIVRNSGVFVCVSFVGQAYMGAYECFKAAQVHLAETIDAELEESRVFAFTIGPGLVPTPGATAGIAELAPLYGKTVDEFFEMSREHIITPEQAGAGFAAAVALAAQFRGQEISSTQALIAAGVPLSREARLEPATSHLARPAEEAVHLCRKVRATLAKQSEAWQERSLFERQWVIRDFRKNAGMPVDQWLQLLDQLADALISGGIPTVPPLDQLASYYSHLAKLAAGYEKDPAKLEEQLAAVRAWELEVRNLSQLLRA